MTAALPNEAYSRRMATALAPMAYQCPRCKSGRGSWCESSGGYRNSAVGFHAARKRLVADLSDDERADLYLAVHAEQQARRAETMRILAGAR